MMFQLVPSGPSLILEWRRPINVPSVVDVNYTISIFGPTNNTGPFVTTETSFFHPLFGGGTYEQFVREVCVRGTSY